MNTEDNNRPKATIKLLVETEKTDENTLFSVDQRDSGGKASISPQGTDHGGGSAADIFDRLAAANMLVPGSALGQDYQDQYRRIKRPILSNAFGKTASLVERGNLILVTSSVPGEGKTFTAINLALSIAQEKDKTVLLVDCDVARQGASRLLGVENKAGLVEVLEDRQMTIGEVLLNTDIENLRVVSAGKHDEYITEMLSSRRMTELADEIVTRYSDRIIILDGPPLLSTPQTPILASLVGQVVFVVEAGKTSQVLVEDALELVPKEKATGIIMNKNQAAAVGGSGYYAYYGYSTDDKRNAK